VHAAIYHAPLAPFHTFASRVTSMARRPKVLPPMRRRRLWAHPPRRVARLSLAPILRVSCSSGCAWTFCPTLRSGSRVGPVGTKAVRL
jgi:hypothetical protein